MVLMDQGPGRNPPRQRLAKGSHRQLPRSAGSRREEGRKETGGRTAMWGMAQEEGAEGRGARPGWPLKGWPSWGGHFNRPQLNHCRKPLTAPYSLSRPALLLGSQAVMQKDRQPGPLTAHPRPQGQPAPNSSQLPKRVLVFESKAGDPALIWRNPPLRRVPRLQCPLLRVRGLS